MTEVNLPYDTVTQSNNNINNNKNNITIVIFCYVYVCIKKIRRRRRRSRKNHEGMMTTIAGCGKETLCVPVRTHVYNNVRNKNVPNNVYTQ